MVDRFVVSLKLNGGVHVKASFIKYNLYLQKGGIFDTLTDGILNTCH